MKKVLLGIMLSACAPSFSQDSTNRALSLSCFAEVYYLYDFNKPREHNLPGFIYSHNRHNEVNLNLGLVKAGYATETMRANLAIATGTYINANYSAEPGVLKNLFEANMGLKLSKKRAIWLDAGIMPSHIGFESATSKDCWNLTRSILADNSPYYEGGAKITYNTNNNKWLISLLVLNGWQRITRVNGNSLISWGGQLQYKPSGNILLNYSNFLGTDKPDSSRLIRLFHNLYGIFNISTRVSLITGFDLGTEQKLPGSKVRNIWYSPILIIKYDLHTKWTIAGRAEYYRDKGGVILNPTAANGFRITGLSANIDHRPVENMIVRLEARSLISNNNNTNICFSMAVSF